MNKSDRFQFGIRRLLILTTAVGLIIGVVIRINAPGLLRLVVAAYFIIFAGWIIMRLPGFFAKFSELRERTRQLKKHRRDLDSDVLSAKEAVDAGKAATRSDRG